MDPNMTQKANSKQQKTPQLPRVEGVVAAKRTSCMVQVSTEPESNVSSQRQNQDFPSRQKEMMEIFVLASMLAATSKSSKRCASHITKKVRVFNLLEKCPTPAWKAIIKISSLRLHRGGCRCPLHSLRCLARWLQSMHAVL